jgi:hypothetical protein
MAEEAVSIAGTVIAVGLNLSPCILFYEFFRGKRNLSSIPEMMLIMGVFCGTTNFAYGIILSNRMMIINGIICDSLQILYAILYLYYYAGKDCMKWLLYSFIALNLTFEVLYIFANVIEYHTSNEFANYFTGIFNIFMTIINAAAPGQNIVVVFKTKNFTLIPVWTTFAQLLCSGLWGVYGFFIPEIKMIIPNVIGSLLCIFQIIAYFYARISSGGLPPKKEEDKDKDNADEDNVDTIGETSNKEDKDVKLLDNIDSKKEEKNEDEE